MPIGSRIRDRRMELGISVDDLAEMLGVHRATIYRYESEEIGNFPISLIPALARALKVSAVQIWDWIGVEDIDPVNEEDDEVENEIITLFSELSPEKQNMALEYIRFLASQP